LRFMGIFSNNLDEFFRVRVASVTRLLKLDKADQKMLGYSPQQVLKQIKQIVLRQQQRFEKLFNEVLIKELEEEKIFIINDTQLNVSRGQFVKDYFNNKVLPSLVPIMIDPSKPFPELKDRSIYLFIKLYNRDKKDKFKYSLIEIPTDIHSRFLVLPETNKLKFVILLDDIIRYCLEDIFKIFNFKDFEAYTIKLTRDAEIDFDFNDLHLNMVDAFSKSVKQRKKGKPIRFVYDQALPREMVNFLKLKLGLQVDNLIPGGRYHNFKDFISFPNLGQTHLEYSKNIPLDHEVFRRSNSILNAIQQDDQMLHFPYQKFDYLIEFLREAAIDPKVQSIKITLYRIAQNSMIANALINAVRNGKKVVVVLELKARFDEENNIYYTQKFLDEGVVVLHSIPEMKIHSKICLVTRKEKNKLVHYANIGTGNYNEKTANIYADHSFFTADKQITSDVQKVFAYLEKGKLPSEFSNLLVAPFNLRSQLIHFIKKEIEHAKKGLKSGIFLKLNSLADEEIIQHLYDASKAGVKIKIIVRGICCLIPGQKNLSENIEVISIIDKFLEHARVYMFENAGNDRIYISSADMMIRNLDMRVEVACPINNTKIKSELKKILDMQWKDNSKARIVNVAQNNIYKKARGSSHRSQFETYQYLKDK
ncbi:MAG: polyphosphate kinase 1, partial [bacterium]